MAPVIEKNDLIRYALILYQTNTPNHLSFQFKEDFAKIFFIQRLFRNYRSTGTLNVRLMINYTIILYNSFGSQFTPFFFMYLDRDLKEWNAMFTILKILNRIPDDLVLNILGQSIDLSSCEIDEAIHGQLQEDFNGTVS